MTPSETLLRNSLVMAVVLLAASPVPAAELFRSLEPIRLTRAHTPGALQSLRVVVATEVLAAGSPAIAVDLPAGDRLWLRLRLLERRAADDVTWRGRVEDTQDGEAVLTLKKGHVAGLIYGRNGVYVLRPTPSGQVLSRIDQSLYPPCGVDVAGSFDSVLRPATTLPEKDDPSSIDVLVLYTGDAESAAGGSAAIEATIQNAVDLANTALENSDLTTRFNLVRTAAVEYDEWGDGEADLDWVTSDPEVANLRDQSAADLVSLIVADMQYCGIAWSMRDPGPGFADLAFQVTLLDCAVDNLTWAHEHGHNLGCEHDPANGPPPDEASYDWSYGHYVDGVFRTVMAYETECMLGCDRIAHFSNPGVTYGVHPTGITGTRMNYYTIKVNSSYAANFRQSDTLPWVSVESASVREGDSGTVALEFEVWLTKRGPQPVTVELATRESGSATAGSDYTSTSGSLAFGTDTTDLIFVVEVKGDAVDEGYSEQFELEITSATNANVNRSTALGSILDDDDSITAGIWGEGTILIGQDPQFTCPDQCQRTYPRGSVVQLTAVASAGWKHSYWVGACGGQGASCTLTLTRDVSTQAIFDPDCVYETNAHYNNGEATLVGLVVADLDGNSTEDLVHHYTASGLVVLSPYLADADNAFLAQPPYNSGTHYNGFENPTTFGILAADVDGDGRDDLIHYRTDQFNSVPGHVIFRPHLADGSGGFVGQPVFPTGDHYNGYQNPTIYGVVTADVNGDGRHDLVHYRTDNHGAESGYVIFLPHLGDGTGSFLSQPVYDTNTHYNGYQNPTMFGIRVADVNGDGRDDLVHYRTNNYGGAPGYLVFFPHLGDGTGSFTPQPAHQTGTHYNGYQNPTIYGVVVADVNGDGNDDLVHYYTVNHGAVSGFLAFRPHLANGSGGFLTQPPYDTNTHYNGYQNPTMYGLVVADLDGNGRDDLVHYNTATTSQGAGMLIFRPHLSSIDGGFTPQPAYDTRTHFNWGYDGAAYTLYGVKVADLNGDGCDDLIHYYTRQTGDLFFVRHLSNCSGGFLCAPVTGAPPAPSVPSCTLEVGVIGEGSVVAINDLQGCCSSHEGVCGCEGGRALCCDATFSPSCICSTIDCPGICEEQQLLGSSAALRAVPPEGWQLNTWLGACAGQPSDCALTLTGDAVAVAGFLPARRALDVVFSGTGRGMITSDPAGISCGVDCGEGYPHGTVVSLAVQVGAYSEFLGWGGDPDCADQTLTMNQDRTCIVTFGLITEIFADGFESGDVSQWTRSVP